MASVGCDGRPWRAVPGMRQRGRGSQVREERTHGRDTTETVLLATAYTFHKCPCMSKGGNFTLQNQGDGKGPMDTPGMRP